MADKDNLKDMLDNIINDKKEQAQTNFHSYVRDKMKEVMNDKNNNSNDNQ